MSNMLSIKDPSGKEITPDNMKNGSNGSFTLPNGATVTVSSGGAQAKLSVNYLGLTKDCQFNGAGNKGGHDTTTSTYFA